MAVDKHKELGRWPSRDQSTQIGNRRWPNKEQQLHPALPAPHRIKLGRPSSRIPAMGNSSSNANNTNKNPGPQQQNRPGDPAFSNSPSLLDSRRRVPSPSPTPGNPHHSLRYKKKSLELPDLVSLSLTPANPPRGRTKTASIPIPVSPGTVQVERRKPIELPSTSSLANAAVRPYPPPSREAQQQAHTERLRQQQQRSHESRQGSAQQHIQELYNQSHQGPSHPRHFVQEVVRSSIPLALAQGREGGDDYLDPLEPLPVTVSWHGGGVQVYLARADDDNWNGRLLMLRECVFVLFASSVHI